MKLLKIVLSSAALALAAANATASVDYTNDSEASQTLTIVRQVDYSYYGFDRWSTTETITVVVAPGETLSYSDYITTHGDGGNYSEVYELTGVE